ncbi:hypothetical protein J3F82_003259 [Coemansia sp. RSA 637]|nr:hypothetical protein J3F82_003259 [Coemansia sp. RSA 637]
MNVQQSLHFIRRGLHCARALRTQNVHQGPTDTLLPGQFLVGAPHPVSNIRPIAFYIASDETPSERTYRLMREEAASTDHLFWADNNTRFERGRIEFERTRIDRTGSCTLDDLSVYFQEYQNESYERHVEYNKYVWKRNWRMVWPGIRAWVDEVRRRGRRREFAVARHAEQGYFFGREGVEKDRVKDVKDGSAPQPSQPEANRRDEKIRSYY